MVDIENRFQPALLPIKEDVLLSVGEVRLGMTASEVVMATLERYPQIATMHYTSYLLEYFSDEDFVLGELMPKPRFWVELDHMQGAIIICNGRDYALGIASLVTLDGGSRPYINDGLLLLP